MKVLFTSIIVTSVGTMLFAQSQEFVVSKIKNKSTFDFTLGSEVYHSTTGVRKVDPFVYKFQYKDREFQLNPARKGYLPLVSGADTVALWDFEKVFFIGKQEYRINRNGTKKWTFEKNKQPVLEGVIENRNAVKYYRYKLLTTENAEALELMSFNHAHKALLKKSAAPAIIGVAAVLGIMQALINQSNSPY